MHVGKRQCTQLYTLAVLVWTVRKSRLIGSCDTCPPTRNIERIDRGILVGRCPAQGRLGATVGLSTHPVVFVIRKLRGRVLTTQSIRQKEERMLNDA